MNTEEKIKYYELELKAIKKRDKLYLPEYEAKHAKAMNQLTEIRARLKYLRKLNEDTKQAQRS